MAHTIDEDTKKIVKAIVHGDQKRQSRRPESRSEKAGAVG